MEIHEWLCVSVYCIVIYNKVFCMQMMIVFIIEFRIYFFPIRHLFFSTIPKYAT